MIIIDNNTIFKILQKPYAKQSQMLKTDILHIGISSKINNLLNNRFQTSLINKAYFIDLWLKKAIK